VARATTLRTIVSPATEHPLTLRDGSTMTMAPLSAADEADVARLLDILGDPRATFFARLAAERERDRPCGALVARTQSGELAGYTAWTAEEGGRSGEIAGAVDRRFADLGLGTLRVRRAAQDALDAGLHSLRVELHPGSTAIAAMLRDCGLHTRWDLDYPIVHVDLLLGTERPGWITPSAAT
jgi:GNAT superfamily N-acetyltransferase